MTREILAVEKFGKRKNARTTLGVGHHAFKVLLSDEEKTWLSNLGASLGVSEAVALRKAVRQVMAGGLMDASADGGMEA